MKHLKIIPLLLFIVLLFIATECPKPRLISIRTGTVISVADNLASVQGEVIDLGEGISEHGHIWSIAPNPNVESNSGITKLGRKEQAGTFISNLSNLSSNTQYYVRAYASDGNEPPFYGDDVIFTTESNGQPTVTTSSVSSLTATSATVGGEVISTGGASVTDRGVFWGTTANPKNIRYKLSIGSGTGSFSDDLTGLSPGTPYMVEAYAINSVDTGYGGRIYFTTEELIVPPTVTTNPVTSFTSISATIGGVVTQSGGATVTERGIYWGNSGDPVNTGTELSIGNGTGSFSVELTGLEADSKYYIEAYAKNSAGTSYGDTVSFTTLEDNSTVVDIDGNVYSTIQIGNQLWMAENLKVTRFADGTSIPLVEENTAWGALTYTDKAYCWYDNQSSNGDTYGALYTWSAAMNGEATSDANPSGVQGVCPEGWHLPSDSEWIELEMYLGMSQSEAYVEHYFRGTDEGGKLKDTGTSHWTSPNTGATNSSGFTALPGSGRYHGPFGSLGTDAYFWTATNQRENEPWVRRLSYNDPRVERNWGSYGGNYGFSVRCVKDE